MSDLKEQNLDPQRDILRSMPCAAESESGVLSCIFLRPVELAPEVLALPEDLFYHAGRRQLLEVVKEFLREGRPIDLITLSEHLERMALLDKVGGPGELGELFVPQLTPMHWGYYLDILKKKLYRRTVIQQARLAEQAAYDSDDDAARKVLLEGIAAFSELASDSPSGQKRWVHVKESVHVVADRLQERVDSKGKVPKSAIATGFTDLDRRMQGLQGGELFIIGARPAMGKSALAANIAANIVLANGHYREFDQAALPLGFVTMEMNHADITERMLVGMSQVDMGKTRTGMFGREDWRAFTRACGELGQAPLHYLDTGKLSVQELMARLRHDVERMGLRVLVVDYLQRLCSDSKRAGQNRNVEIGEISSGLKAIAKDFNLGVIALAQVGRSAEERAGCKPQLADLRESGDIEADADFVGLLYRPGYYERRKAKGQKGKNVRQGAEFNPADDDDEDEDEVMDDKAELILAKMRRGAPEPVELKWDGPRTKFSSTHDRLFSNDDAKREG
jgi:replicative DNA helicase